MKTGNKLKLAGILLGTTLIATTAAMADAKGGIGSCGGDGGYSNGEKHNFALSNTNNVVNQEATIVKTMEQSEISNEISFYERDTDRN